MMDDVNTLRAIARAPQQYSRYDMASALHLVLDRLEASQAREAGLREALEQSELQIEYLHGKFQATGSGNQVLAQIRAALSAAPPREAQPSQM